MARERISRQARNDGDGGADFSAPLRSGRNDKAGRNDKDGGGRTMFAPTETRERIATPVCGLARNDKDGGRGLPRACGPRNDRKVDGSVWEMKKRGSVGVISTAPYCGYSEATLRSLRERGWHLYKDGKRLD